MGAGRDLGQLAQGGHAALEVAHGELDASLFDEGGGQGRRVIERVRRGDGGGGARRQSLELPGALAGSDLGDLGGEGSGAGARLGGLGRWRRAGQGAGIGAMIERGQPRQAHDGLGRARSPS